MGRTKSASVIIALLLCLPLSAQQVNTFIPFGGVNVQTATYVIQASDVGKLIVMNCTSCTVSLPSSIPTGYNSQWAVWITNQNSTALTISPNGLNLNGSASSITIVQNAYYYITTSASAYFGVTAGSQPPGSGGVIPGVIDPVRKVILYADGTAGVTTAFHGQAAVVLGQGAGDGMTATQPQGRFYSTGAGASTNITGGFEQGWGANNGQSAYTFGTVSRQVLSIRTANTTNVRYWIGETDGKVADMGGADATFATDTPNLSYCMFRFSAGVDTTWKAICATSNVAQTVVDTGVAPTTTNATLFEIQNPNYGSLSSVVFSINGVTVATVSTNLPTAAAQFGQMWSIDNKNTANNVGGGFFWGELFFYK